MAQIKPTGSPRRPSRLWSHIVIALFVAAIATSAYGWLLADEARRPIGEGELFLEDIEYVVDQIEASEAPVGEAIRSIRNRLEVEAVSIVGSTGSIEVSTSETLVGTRLDSPLLVDTISTIQDDGSVAPGRFSAVAAAVPDPIEIDGVPMWDEGDVLYQVGHPLSRGGAVLVSYDMSELLARRSAGRGIPQRSIDLFAGAGMIGLAGAGLMMARSRAARTYAVFATEARLLRDQAATLRVHNAELEVARQRAERALDLAEEKNRIRSEFVLMINHELRTPLTGVVSGAQLLTDIVEDEMGSEILEDVISSARRLEDMIGEMLVVARMENRGLFVERVPTRLDEMLSDIEGLSARWDVTVDPEIDGRQEILTDATTLPRLVGSLAANALTHGAENVTVKCVATLPFEPMLEVGERPGDGIYLIVVDDGPGIDADFLPRAFEKFEKRSFSSGTGLGLYMAKMMAEALGASISVLTGPKGTAMAIGVPTAADRELVS